MAEHVATGEFVVQLTPTAPPDAVIGSLAISKAFHGDLVANSTGQMLSMGSPAKGSAGYVAMEQVTGSLAGRQGSFGLQHSGTMDKGAPSLSITVVPDSGTDALAGLTGSMTIKVEGGKHFYSFHYALPG